MEVLIYSEIRNEQLIQFDVVHVQRGMITVLNEEMSVCKTLNAFQVKPFYEDFQPNINFFRSYNNVADSTKNRIKAIQAYDPKSQLFRKATRKEIADL